jgi:hypothetical protein
VKQQAVEALSKSARVTETALKVALDAEALLIKCRSATGSARTELNVTNLVRHLAPASVATSSPAPPQFQLETQVSICSDVS